MTGSGILRAATALAATAAIVSGAVPVEGSRATAACPSPDPRIVAFVPTGPGVAGGGTVELRETDSPYGIAVAADGRYRTRLVVRLDGLLPRPGVTYVVWAAPPSLDEVVRLGALESGSATIDGTVGWNQFLVFVTAEPRSAGARWSGPILLTAMSPSGKMHPKAGHGIFEVYSYLC